MGSKIRVLSESLANKIAAGEVVERPASVVKELVENAIDSGATEITIDINAGGRRSITVMDDGEGMEKDGALLALERHSTSKISASEDLFRISTLGFRGEALPSIAAVSNVRITTKPSRSLAGTQIYSAGGKIKDVREAGCPTGTVVEVNNLFYNTPARLKFLKRDTTEFGHIADVVTEVALANHGIHFKLIHNGKAIIDTPAAKNLLNRVAEVLGRDTCENLYEVSLTEKSVDIRGFMSQPDYTRSTSRALHTYVNGRGVRDRVINHAIMEAYGTLIMKKRYPVVILLIDMPVHWVDVNVHPTKREVRFKEQRKIHDLIVEAVCTTVKKSPWVRGVLIPLEQMTLTDTKAEPHRHRASETLAGYSVSGKDENFLAGTAVPEESAHQSIQMKLGNEEPLFFSSLTPIGQIKDTYLLCSCDEGLILIDQHAAHERVILEMLKKGRESATIASQGLLIPQRIELRHGEARFLEGYLSKLLEVGFEIEPFGGDTFIVKSVPLAFVDKDCRRLILDIVDELYSYGKSLKLEESVEKVLILMACHGAIKANQDLSREEIDTLLQQLDNVGSPTNCPHGRPILRKITYKEIDRMFKRG